MQTIRPRRSGTIEYQGKNLFVAFVDNALGVPVAAGLLYALRLRRASL